MPVPSPGIAARLVVPGWAQIVAGLPWRGWVYLGLFLGLLGLGLLNWGTGVGSIGIGLAFSVHASATIDALLRLGAAPETSTLTTTLLASLALGLVVYLPVGWVVSNVAATREYGFSAPPFERFDVVVFNGWARPRPGNVALFRPVSDSMVGREALVGHVQRVYQETECVDRILGAPGDRVVWDRGTLSVNGSPVRWTPLAPKALPDHLEIDVPADRYLMLPTTSPASAPGLPARSWEARGLYPAEEILGGAYLRLRPLSCPWFIR